MDVLIFLGLTATIGMAFMQWRLWRQVEELNQQRRELMLAMNRLEKLAEEFQAVGRQTDLAPLHQNWPQRNESPKDAAPETALSKDFTLPESWR